MKRLYIILLMIAALANLGSRVIPATGGGSGTIDELADIAVGICSTAEALYNDGNDWTCLAWPSGGDFTFDLDGDDATSDQTVTDAATLVLTGGVGIYTDVSATNTITISTASEEVGFFKDNDTTSHTCSSGEGSAVVHNTEPLAYCDGSDVLRRAAYGNATGGATALASNALSSITQVHTDVRSGTDPLVTGTGAGDTFCAEWDGSGDLGNSGEACVTGSHTTAGGAGTDTTAIHGETDDEIILITDKPTPLEADVLIIESDAHSYAKRSITISSIDHDHLTNSTDTNAHIDWESETAGTIHPDNYSGGCTGECTFTGNLTVEGDGSPFSWFQGNLTVGGLLDIKGNFQSDGGTYLGTLLDLGDIVNIGDPGAGDIDVDTSTVFQADVEGTITDLTLMGDAQIAIIWAGVDSVTLDCDNAGQNGFLCGAADIIMDEGDGALFVNVGGDKDVMMLAYHDQSRNYNVDDDTPEAGDGDFADAVALEGDGSLSDNVIDTFAQFNLCVGEGQDSVLLIDNGTGEASCKEAVPTTITAIGDGDIMIGSSGEFIDLQMNGDATMDATGDVTLDPDINFLTTGTVSGGIKVVVSVGADTPAAVELRGAAHIAAHTTPTSNLVYTLPDIATILTTSNEDGASACFYDNGAGAGGVRITPAGGDSILLNGTSGAAGEAIDSPGVDGDGANGDYICLLAIDTDTWISLGRSGDWEVTD